MINVLLLGAGTQGLAMVDALRRARCRVVVAVTERDNYGDRSRFIDKCYTVQAGDTYLDAVKDIIAREHIDAVIPMGDATAELLSRHLPGLEALTRVLLPPVEVFMRGYDKNSLMRLCAERGYPHPDTLDLAGIDPDRDGRVERFPYPALLKPNRTTGGRGMCRVDSARELRARYPGLRALYGDYHLQRLIPAGGRQVKAQLLVDRRGRLAASSVIEKRRWYPVEGGSNSCAVAIEDPDTVNLCTGILRDLGWVGFADFDLIEDPDTRRLLVMEINPRVPACVKAPIAAGLNWGEAIVDAALDRPVKPYPYHAGTVLRHLGFEVLWFLQSPDRWHTSPSWFRFFGRDVHYQDMGGWNDPLPFICGTWRNIKQLLSGHGKG